MLEKHLTFPKFDSAKRAFVDETGWGSQVILRWDEKSFRGASRFTENSWTQRKGVCEKEVTTRKTNKKKTKPETECTKKAGEGKRGRKKRRRPRGRPKEKKGACHLWR